MKDFTFEEEIKKGIVTLKVFDKEKFDYSVFRDMEPYLQELFIATICHLDTLMNDYGAKRGDIKGLMMQMDPDDWESRYGTAPILVLHKDNRLSNELRNVLLREDYIFFPMYGDSEEKDTNTIKDYEKSNMKEVYSER